MLKNAIANQPIHTMDELKLKFRQEFGTFNRSSDQSRYLRVSFPAIIGNFTKKLTPKINFKINVVVI
jgi:hypothetical protein